MANQAKSNEGREPKTSTSPLTWGLTVAGLVVSALLLTVIRRRESIPESRSDVVANVLPAPIASTLSRSVQDKPMPVKTTPKIHTLSEFFEQNEKLVSVLGVFTAVSLFVSGLPIHYFAYWLSFLFMVLTIILWLELWAKFPSGVGDWKISVFEDLLLLAMLALVLYMLVDFRGFVVYPLVLVIFSTLLGVFSYAMKRFDLFNKLLRSRPGKHKLVRYLLGLAVGIASLLLTLELARFIAPGLIRILDATYKLLSEQPR